jgi:hypothetical protein
LVDEVKHVRKRTFGGREFEVGPGVARGKLESRVHLMANRWIFDKKWRGGWAGKRERRAEEMVWRDGELGVVGKL